MLDVLDEAAAAVARMLGGLDDWGLAGTREGQYRSDLAADEAVLAVLDAAGFGVLSEESGLHEPARDVLVVVDPVDGSTNAWRGIPWFATSLCAVDADGPAAALVVNLASGTRFSAVRGEGAFRDGVRVRPSGCSSLGEAVVGLSGYPSAPLGWRQFRALGAAALDLCAVACGWLDGYVDCSVDAHGVWDYLGGLLVCQEAGAFVAEAFDRDLVVRDPALRRTPLAAGSEPLLAEIVAARRNLV
ncbi:MAG TPA: inositol monophosphatase family protein [Acidimicrobiales bacterium]|nr:inositol monophosphatase family protein [Acidimicrobiales bacterium]